MSTQGPMCGSSHTIRERTKIKAASTSMSNLAPNFDSRPIDLAIHPSTPSSTTAEVPRAVSNQMPPIGIRWRNPMVDAKIAVIMRRSNVIQFAAPNRDGALSAASMKIVISEATK